MNGYVTCNKVETNVIVGNCDKFQVWL